METSFPPVPRPINKRFIVLAVAAVVVLSAGILGVSWLLEPQVIGAPASAAAVSKPVITITDTGFVPATLRIAPGTQVRWVNKTTKPHGVGANPYPERTDLPSLYSTTPIAPGDSYEFTFTNAGSWSYNDTTNPTSGGTVIAQ